MKIAHISLYPPRGAKHVEGSGVISYTKNLVTHIDNGIEQHMLTHRINGKTETYEEDGVTVHRCFDRSPAFIGQLNQKLRQIQPDVIHIQQELALFGGIATAYLLQHLVRQWGSRVALTMHHVVNPKTIDKKFVHENNSQLPVWAVRLAFNKIYRPLVKYAAHIIVHEPLFKNIVIKSYNAAPDKITVIPHGVEDLNATPTQRARRKLQLKPDSNVALYMGYATGYKGLDLLIEGFAEYAKRDPKAFLLIGAGQHPKLLDNAAYLAKYKRWQDKATQLIPRDQYRWIGFISEDEIADYYGAADVSLYPYTTTLSSSGPMALAIGFEKPFLGSKVFENIFGNYPQLLFDQTPDGMAQKLTHFFEHQATYRNISVDLKAQRTWDSVGASTAHVYQTIQASTVTSTALTLDDSKNFNEEQA